MGAAASSGAVTRSGRLDEEVYKVMSLKYEKLTVNSTEDEKNEMHGTAASTFFWSCRFGGHTRTRMRQVQNAKNAPKNNVKRARR